MSSPGDPRNTIARKPSHFGSYRKSLPSGRASTALASMGATGGAITKRSARGMTWEVHIVLHGDRFHKTGNAFVSSERLICPISMLRAGTTLALHSGNDMSHRHVRALALAAFAALALFIAHPRATNGTWTIMPPLPSPTQEVSVIALNNLVYVAAGSANQARTNALWTFDPATSAWTSLAPYPGTPRDHVGIATVGGFLYLIGGVTSWPLPSMTNFDRYDPATNSWAAMAPLPIARGATGVSVLNGKIYVAGGLEAAVSVKDFTAYDPATNTWQTLPDMPTARDHLTAATLNGKFYALGGRINGQTCNPM